MVEWDVVLLAIALEDDENVPRKKRKQWIDDLWLKRCQIGEFHTLHCDLRFNPRKFYDYYRMDIEKYENLVNLLRPRIQKLLLSLLMSYRHSYFCTKHISFSSESITSCKKHYLNDVSPAQRSVLE